MKFINKIRGYLLYNTSTKQTIIKNTFWLVIAEGVSKGSLFLISIFIARQLGPEQFGIMSFVMSFVSIFILITDFGLTTLMMREVSRDQSKLSEYFVNCNFLKVILGILTFGLVRGISQFIGKPDFYITLILIYCGYAIINNIGEFIRSFFRPSEHMQYETILKIINGVLALTIIGGALWMGYGLEGLFYAYLVAGGISLLVSLGFVVGKKKINGFKINRVLITNSLRVGLFLSAGMLSVNGFQYADQLIIGFFRTEVELGYYAVAYKIVGIIALLAVLMANVLYPQMVKMQGQKDRVKKFISHISKIILVGGGLFIILNLIISHRLIPIVFGQEYISAVAPYNILIFAVIIILFNNIFGNLLIIHNKEKQYLISVVIGLIANIILNIIFIPIYGIMAAAVTTVITEGICLGLYCYFNRKYL